MGLPNKTKRTALNYLCTYIVEKTKKNESNPKNETHSLVERKNVSIKRRVKGEK
jgi:hypothetical protein